MTSPRRVEFILLVALLNALVAISIDTMLPALGVIAHDLGAANPNDRQFIITAFFTGMTLGTLIYGPASDTVGRKPAIFVGLLIFTCGALLAMTAQNFNMILGGRFIQGLGAAAPGFVSTAMVRDGLAGSAMARVMSFVMTVFMLAPIIAPSIGQLVLLVLNWRFIFAGFVVIGFSAGIWLWVRQPETLSKDKRRPFSAKHYWRAGIEACRHPVMIGYTLAAGFVFSGLVAYLGTSQQIFVDQYQQGGYFALWFAAFAVALALAMIANGRFVMTIGMRRITQYALYSATCLSAISAGIAALYQGQPPLLLFGGYIFVNFFCMGLLFGNYNALALEPVGHIAGMASAMSGFISSSLSIIGGAIVGQAYHGTVTPLIVGFAIFGLMGIIVTEWAEAHRHSALEAKSGTP